MHPDLLFCCRFLTVVASSLSRRLLALQSLQFSRLLTSEEGNICKNKKKTKKMREKSTGRWQAENKRAEHQSNVFDIFFTSYLESDGWELTVKAGSKSSFPLPQPFLCFCGRYMLWVNWSMSWTLVISAGVCWTSSSFLAELWQRSPSLWPVVLELPDSPGSQRPAHTTCMRSIRPRSHFCIKQQYIYYLNGELMAALTPIILQQLLCNPPT